MMRAFLTTRGKRHRTQVDRRGDAFTAVIDGEAFMGRLDPEKATVQLGDRVLSYRVRPQGIELDGRLHAVEWEADVATLEEARAAEGRAAVHAQMPGRVVAVLVAAGDEVRKGQRLLILEAMKMQNEVPAPASGRVRAVHVKPGDSVTPRDILLELS